EERGGAGTGAVGGERGREAPWRETLGGPTPCPARGRNRVRRSDRPSASGRIRGADGHTLTVLALILRHRDCQRPRRKAYPEGNSRNTDARICAATGHPSWSELLWDRNCRP